MIGAFSWELPGNQAIRAFTWTFPGVFTWQFLRLNTGVPNHKDLGNGTGVSLGITW